MIGSEPNSGGKIDKIHCDRPQTQPEVQCDMKKWKNHVTLDLWLGLDFGGGHSGYYRFFGFSPPELGSEPITGGSQTFPNTLHSSYNVLEVIPRG